MKKTTTKIVYKTRHQGKMSTLLLWNKHNFFKKLQQRMFIGALSPMEVSE